MVSKVAFIFLMVCFIAMIGLGISNLRCYEKCNLTDPNCENGTIMKCPSNVVWCVKDYFGSGQQCLYSNVYYELCNNDLNCKPCKEELCNTVP